MLDAIPTFLYFRDRGERPEGGFNRPERSEGGGFGRTERSEGGGGFGQGGFGRGRGRGGRGGRGAPRGGRGAPGGGFGKRDFDRHSGSDRTYVLTQATQFCLVDHGEGG